MNPHIAAKLAAERRCDLLELAVRDRAALDGSRRRGLRERVGAYRRLRRATARTR
jgi:hypothetical protein